MAKYTRTLTDFVGYTAVDASGVPQTNMNVGDKLRPAVVNHAPGFEWRLPNNTWEAYPINNEGTVRVTHRWLDPAEAPNMLRFTFIPTSGAGPWTLRVKVWLPDTSTQEFTQTLTEMKEVTQALPAIMTLEVRIQDKDGNSVSLKNTMSRSASLAAGYWESKPIFLSSLLLEVNKVELTGRSPSNSSRVGPDVLLPWKTITLDTWPLQFMGTRGKTEVTPWRSTLPTRAEILQHRIDSIRVRVNTPANPTAEDVAYDLRITYNEEYATSNPSVPARHSNDNLYVPRITVTLDDEMDVSKYVVSFQTNSLELVLPDDRLEGRLTNNPMLTVTLDGNLAYKGRVTNFTKATFATGIRYTLEATSLYELLAGKMDSDILVGDLDANGKMELGFFDDGAYIAYVTSHMPGVGVRPILYENHGFRPIEAWFQGNSANLNNRVIRLDADFDWYQIYTTQNQSVRGKLKDVANANFYEFTSIGGHPALVPMAREPKKSLLNLKAHVYNMTPTGTYLPESRLFVPEYTLDTSHLPKKLKVQGLETVDGREDVLLSSVPIYHNTEDGPTYEFIIEARLGGRAVADYYFTDPQGNAAVYQTVEVKRLSIIDGWPGPKNYSYRFIHSSERPDYVEGFSGYIGIHMELKSGTLEGLGLHIELDGKLLYSASGERGEPPISEAVGDFLPLWAKQPSNFMTELVDMAGLIPRDEEVVHNDFVTTYYLPPRGEDDAATDANIADWNASVVGKEAKYGRDEHGIYLDLRGWRHHERDASRLADYLVLERVLKVLSIELKYVGHPGLKHGDFIGIARRPSGGEHAKVTHIDYFMVLGDFQLSFQAGGSVVTSMQAGYIGTKVLGTTPSVVRDLDGVRWFEPIGTDEALFF